MAIMESVKSDSVTFTPAKPVGLALLRERFPAHQISQLPKPFKRDAPKGKCSECGGYHGLPALHLDYVGHAALTDRLLDADPSWTWEPVATPASLGLPVWDGGMWIRLTVCGVTRFGFGCADGKSGGDAVKEMIGDALRNAAMRFGAALDLWHKGSLHDEGDNDADATTHEPMRVEPVEPAGFRQWVMDLEAVAAEGTDALKAAWQSSKANLRTHMTTWSPAKWEALKRQAASVAPRVELPA